MNSIKEYGEADRVSVAVHYYSARVLISLLAPIAPAFAKECRVLLYYGPEKDREVNEPGYFFGCEAVKEMIQEKEGRLLRFGLPRQGQPDTLCPIFDRPFPFA